MLLTPMILNKTFLRNSVSSTVITINMRPIVSKAAPMTPFIILIKKLDLKRRKAESLLSEEQKGHQAGISDPFIILF